MDEPPIPTLKFSEAKTALSEVMTAVVHEHQPRVIERRNGKEAMVLLRDEDVVEMLGGFRFDAQVSLGEGEATAALPELGVLGFGAGAEEAMEDLVRELRAYAQRFFERYSFYRETDRARHAPWLLRFSLTPSDRQLDLLYRDIQPYVLRVLKRELHMNDEQIAKLSPDEAEKLVHDHWSRPGEG